MAPENTVRAIERGLAGGADAIELDLHASADGHLVAIHDDLVDRTTDGTGPIEAMSLPEIRRLDAGHYFSPDGGRSFPFRGSGLRIPTLDEAVEAAAGLPMVLEVKSTAAGQALRAWLEARESDAGDIDRFVVGGFDRRLVAPAASAARWQCATRADLIPFVVLGKFGVTARLRPEISALMVPIRKGPLRLVTAGFVRRAHLTGVGVFVWTVNRPDVMRQLLDLGVDGLISDVPARARRVLAERYALGFASGRDVP